MRKIDHFTNQYPLSKTLCFKLIPVEETEKYFILRNLLDEDEERAREYVIVKKLIDRYHKEYIERVLSGFQLEDLMEYAQIYSKSNRTANENTALDSVADKMRTSISKRFKKGTFSEEYKKLFLADMIQRNLPTLENLTEEEKTALEHFYNFTTYFKGFHENRKNMYTGEGKATEIAFRIIDQNLPKFLDNCKIGLQALKHLEKTRLEALENALLQERHLNLADLFQVSFFNQVLTQKGIDDYNYAIGKVNEQINEYRQQTKQRIPLLKPLFKQILSDRTSMFSIEQFDSDKAVLSNIYDFYTQGDKETGRSLAEVISKITAMLSDISQYQQGVYIRSGSAITDLSQGAFNSWHQIQDALNVRYNEAHPRGRRQSEEKYLEARSKHFKEIRSYSVAELCSAVQDKNLLNYITAHIQQLGNAVEERYEAVSALLETPYPTDRKLMTDEHSVELLKNFLDAVKDYQHFAGSFMGSGKEENKNELFYGEFEPLYEQLNAITPLYNKVRNYVTQKPYSKDKIKLNFGNSILLDGWSVNKEKDFSAVLLQKDGCYYLGIMDYQHRKLFIAPPEPSGDEPVYQKMYLNVIPDPSKMLPKVFFAKKNLSTFNPSAELIEKKNAKLYKKGPDFDLSFCRDLIDYYKISLQNHEEWNRFHYTFPETEEYNNLPDFYEDVRRQSYRMTFAPIPEAYISQLVSEGKLYLFQIYNKDFSPYSKGTPNLHTLYFKTLFSEENLANITFALNGGAELFYRKASLKRSETTVHSAQKPIVNKNPNNPKKTSVFPYEIIKNRRFTERQFEFHVPITMNYQAKGINAKEMNLSVRRVLRECDDNYVIGIDRGERNLLYVCVIDGKGRIVEQFSLNSIISRNNDIEHKTDYHALLSRKEEERDKSRKNWQSIEGIKELKEGYLSQAVHQICLLVEKYDAVIAMEDLNTGFKNSRSKVEKSVYQKFEKMLIDKLNFFADKHKNSDEVGGLLAAYQLTNKFESFAKMSRQNGFIFYVPAWLTSKIDPATGFVDLLHPSQRMNKEMAQEFIQCFDRISYEDGDFVFRLDYSKFPNGSTDHKKHWMLTTAGTRIKTFRDPKQNQSWVSKDVELSPLFYKLFDRYGISLTADDLREQICNQKDAGFYRELIGLIRLMLQMRNSETGTDIDYLFSPAVDKDGIHFDSRNYSGRNASMPIDADGNGAYHIARKAQWVIKQLKAAEINELDKVKLSISNKEWLEYVQSDENI